MLGLATGVMAYVLWENDGRNAHERPTGRSLPELVRRRYYNEEPPASLYAGPEATTRSLFHIPSASHKTTPTDSASSRSTEQIIADAKDKAARAKGQAGAICVLSGQLSRMNGTSPIRVPNPIQTFAKLTLYNIKKSSYDLGSRAAIECVSLR